MTLLVRCQPIQRSNLSVGFPLTTPPMGRFLGPTETNDEMDDIDVNAVNINWLESLIGRRQTNWLVMQCKSYMLHRGSVSERTVSAHVPQCRRIAATTE